MLDTVFDSKTTIGRIVRGVAAQYIVDMGGELISCTARGRLRSDGALFVGDFVCADTSASVITEVKPRKNFLKRPPVANIDQAVFVLAPSPPPDFLLLDKLVISCLHSGIDVLLCVNKCDAFSEGFSALYDAAVREYTHSCVKVFKTSATEGILDGLERYLNGKVTAFAGQSAAGKSSLMRVLLPGIAFSVGEVSGNNRGRHTTRKVELHPFMGGYIADTPGFSLLGIDEIDYFDIDYYYPLIFEAGKGCRFNRCAHINEPGCAVREKAASGEIPPEMYSRYLKIRDEVKKSRKY